MPTRIPLPFITGFSAENVNGKKTKSSAFQAVEAALDKYSRSSTRENLLALTQCLGDWKLGKVDRAKNKNWSQSVRAAAVTKLSAWLIEESKAIGLFPTSRSLWGGNHNCYAYAMKCKSPKGLGQNSWAGKFANFKNEGDFPRGVVEDGKAQGKAIVVLGQDLPNPVPQRLSDGNYLVAMVSNGMGYHFMRRRESTGLWTHKNGASSEVETYFYDTELEQPVAITDAVVAKILADPKLIGCSMTFKRYFKVPGPGMQVTG